MKNTFFAVIAAFFFCIVTLPMPVFGEDANQTNNTDVHTLQSVIAGLKLSGGISAGAFYASNAGQGSSDSEFLLSNLLVEISQKDKTTPIGFTAAFGETSTPPLIGEPENKNDLEIEYASLSLAPLNGLSFEIGLLQPNAGYENSYTFNNPNAFLGALASQQPYNAYGASLTYGFLGMHLYVGYYRDRLDRDEYITNGSSPNESWEVGLSGTIFDTTVSLYHYYLESLRSLTGTVIERSFANVVVGINVDYWRWDDSMKSLFEGDASIGVAVYAVPGFGRFSIPVRLEYIDQGKSELYLDSVNAQQIYAATISPTFHCRDNAYIRADLGYVKADDGFSDTNGNARSERVCLAAEIGFTF